jgi:hypothetical protein
MMFFIELALNVLVFYWIFSGAKRGWVKREKGITPKERERLHNIRLRRIRQWVDPDLEERVRAEVELAAINPAKFDEIWERIEEYSRLYGSATGFSFECWWEWEQHKDRARLPLYYGKERSLKNIYITRELLMNTYGKLTVRGAADSYSGFLPSKYDNIDRGMSDLYETADEFLTRVHLDPSDRDDPRYKVWWREPLTEDEKELRSISRALSLEVMRKSGVRLTQADINRMVDDYYVAKERAETQARRAKIEATKRMR